MSDHKPLTYDDLMKIVKLIESSSQFNEFRLQYGSFELYLSKHGSQSAGASLTGQRPREQAQSPTEHATAPAVATQHEPAPPAKAYAPGSAIVRSPMVGTCYLSPEPGAQPFVSIGERVAKGQPLCIIEVMKLMNSITATQPGILTHVLVTDAQPVGFDQDLFVIDPAS